MYPSVRNRFRDFNQAFEGAVAPSAKGYDVQGRLSHCEHALKARPGFQHFEKWPADAQLALLSMAWALGPAVAQNGAFGRLKNLGTACAAEHFEAAAAACATASATGARNRANAVLFINAACVVTDGHNRRYQRSVLYYPRMLSVQDSGDLTQAHAGHGSVRAADLLVAQSRLAECRAALEAVRANEADEKSSLQPTSRQREMVNNLISMTNICLEQHTGGKSGEAYESRRDNRLILMALRGLRDGNTTAKPRATQRTGMSPGEYAALQNRLKQVEEMLLSIPNANPQPIV